MTPLYSIRKAFQELFCALQRFVIGCFQFVVLYCPAPTNANCLRGLSENGASVTFLTASFEL